MLKTIVDKFYIIELLATSVISLFECRIIYFIHNEKLNYLAYAAHSVIAGKTIWKGFQSRLLGPYLVKLADIFTNNAHASSYFLFLVIMIFVTNYVLFLLFFKLSGDRTVSVQNVLFFSAAFIALQDYTFLYTWDLISLLIFSIFAYAVHKKKGIIFFVILFFIELFNREDAIYIAAWLIIDSFEYCPETKFKISLVAGYKVVIGVILMLTGIIYTAVLRNLLSTVPAAPGTDSLMSGNKNVLFQNIKLFINNFWSLNIMISILLMYLVYYFSKNIRTLSDHYFKIFIIFVCMFSSVLFFGNINETRVWFIFIPLYLVSQISLKYVNTGKTA